MAPSPSSSNLDHDVPSRPEHSKSYSHSRLLSRSITSLSRATKGGSTMPSPPPPPSAPGRPMQRSYSQSHTQRYSVIHKSPSLGQGATVVRTPMDATKSMAQPGHVTKQAWPLYRQASLRDSRHRPTTSSQPLTRAPSSRVMDPSPVLAPMESPSLCSDLRRTVDIDYKKTTPLSIPLSNVSPQRGSQETIVVTAPLRVSSRNLRTRAPPSGSHTDYMAHAISTESPCSTSPRRQLRPVASVDVDIDAAYRQRNGRRLTSRASHNTLSPIVRIAAPFAAIMGTGGQGNEALTPQSQPATPRAAPQSPVSQAPFLPVVISRTVRPATDARDVVLVTLRFGFSLDAEPNTHSITITLETLRPAGGRLVAFLDNAMRPVSGESDSAGSGETGPEMTDGSSAEDSDFEYDDTRVHPHIQDEYNVALALSQSSDLKYEDEPSTPRGPGGRDFPPSSFAPLPPLASLPAALAQAREREREAVAQARAQAFVTAPRQQPLSTSGRPRAQTCPGPTLGMVTEITLLLERDARAWHAIASRLCSGSWPSLELRRKRVEDECQWAGMDGLVSELAAMRIPTKRGGFF